MAGYVKLYRKLEEKGYYKNSKYVHLWIHLLMKANHKGNEFMFNKKLTKINPGQFITGRKKLSEETNINSNTIENILTLFENEQQIEQQKTNKYRIITIKEWKQYQSTTTSQQQNNNRVTTKQQQNNTNKNEENEEKNISFETFWNLYDKKRGDKSKIEKKWNKLTLEIQQKIIDYIPGYIKSQPDKKFRKDPQTFFNNESWNDEIIEVNNTKSNCDKYGNWTGGVVL